MREVVSSNNTQKNFNSIVVQLTSRVGEYLVREAASSSNIQKNFNSIVVQLTSRVGEVLFKTRAALSHPEFLRGFAFVPWIYLTIVLHVNRELQKQI